MFRRLCLFLCALSWASSTPVLCAESQAGAPASVRVLLLPLAVEVQDPEGFERLDRAAFYRLIEERVEARGAGVDLVLPEASDPRLQGWDPAAEVDPAVPVSLARPFRLPWVVWARVEFRIQHQLQERRLGDVPGQELTTGDPAPRNLITVGGIARMGLAEVESGEVLHRGPVALFRSRLTRSNVGTEVFQEEVHGLTLECAEDLADKLVDQITRLRGPLAPAGPAGP